MKLEFTKEQHAEFIRHHFQVITGYVFDENYEIYYILPSKENYTKDDQMIAKIQAEKFGFKVNDSYMVEDYKPENKTFCANYPEKPNTSNMSTTKPDLKDIQIVYSFFREESWTDEEIKKGLELPEKCDDPVVEKVREKLLSRSKIGLKKYGEKLGNYKKYNFISEMQQEALDFANYCEVELQKEETINQLIQKYNNDQELGFVIRKLYS